MACEDFGSVLHVIFNVGQDRIIRTLGLQDTVASSSGETRFRIPRPSRSSSFISTISTISTYFIVALHDSVDPTVTERIKSTRVMSITKEDHKEPKLHICLQKVYALLI
jgi:hypothetical protein